MEKSHSLLKKCFIEVFEHKLSILILESKPLEYHLATLDLSDSGLEGLVLQVNRLELWVAGILEYISSVDRDSLETRFGHTRLSILSIQRLDSFYSMLNLLKRLFLRLLFLLLPKLGLIEGNTEALTFITLQLDEHLFLVIHKLLLILLPISNGLLLILFLLFPFGCC